MAGIWCAVEGVEEERGETCVQGAEWGDHVREVEVDPERGQP